MLYNRLRSRVPIVLLVLLVIGCARSPKPRAEAPAAAAAADETITLLYDVRDLLAVRATDVQVSYDEYNWPRFDGTPEPAPTRGDRVQAIRQLLMKSIDPISWRDRANGPGFIDEEAGLLIVTQLPENHPKVERVLSQLREARALQITVSSFVLSGDDVGDSIERAAGKWRDVDSSTQMVYLTAEQLRQLVEDRHRNGELLSAPRVTLFNGQRSFVIVASETAYTAGYAPAADARAGAEAKPEALTRTVSSGIAIDCVAMVSGPRRDVTLSLHPRVSTLRDMKQVPWPDAPARERQQLQVQVPHVATAAVDLTVSVPNDGCILLRTTPKLHPPDDNAPPPQPVHLAFCATVIEPDLERE